VVSEPYRIGRRVRCVVPSSGSWSSLPQEFASQLFSSATPHRLKVGATLFQAGDEGDGCYRIDKGFLKVCLTSPEGDERILAILTPGAVVGDLAMIDGLPRSASVVALTDCELLLVCRTAFENSVSQNPEIYRYLVRVLAARLRDADGVIATLAFLSVRGRVVHALLDIARTIGVKTGSLIEIPRLISQKDLAAMAGVARENVNRVLNDLERKKILSKSLERYRVEDEARLEQEVLSEGRPHKNLLTEM
jgi:CRP/FNR family transcriptional regulator, cyclic AMP receptor protein